MLFPATVASAVNEFTISNAAASGRPSILATGGDTNIDARQIIINVTSDKAKELTSRIMQGEV